MASPLSPEGPTSARVASAGEVAADGVIHLLGIGLGIPAAVALVMRAALKGGGGPLAASCIYAVGLIAMLACSAAYNVFRTSRQREMLRRLDHAAIFAMIAGTYTPFTTLCLDGSWSVGLTAAIWAIAVTGIAAKLWQPRRIEPISVALYLALGWIGLVAINPFIAAMDTRTLVLIAAGGLIYSTGVIFHLRSRLPYQNAIWHGFVLVAAGTHYLAVLAAVSA